MAAKREFVKLVEELVGYIGDSDVRILDLEVGGEKFYIKKNVFRTESVPSVEPKIKVSEVILENKLLLVNSEIVGTYYSTFGKEKLPFVENGEYVRKGQKLCMIQCLGIDHIISSPSSGRIEELFCKNEENVEYGQKLFNIDTSVGEI